MKKRESIYKNTKSFFLGLFIGVIVLLLISNFLYPILSRGNSNLNQNSEIGKLYQNRYPSEDYKCNDKQNEICKNGCFTGCEPADNQAGYQCTTYMCDLLQRECDGKGGCIQKDLCLEHYCPPCTKCKIVGKEPTCDIVLTDGTPCNIGDNICNPGECSLGTCKPDPSCENVYCPVGQVCVDGICDKPLST